eukprot:TRINITY_DN867_c0_g1_i12.p1 TRINITY_DN867_c0_g1~~TRINITY_DN867_c0_g1_i12.p1  ORF type:complete len:1187 (+),score=232.09 TRINITY_DN867_c0_g1_i12:63-3623(+)
MVNLFLKCLRRFRSSQSQGDAHSRRCDLYYRTPLPENAEERPFCRNKIRTAKYTIFSFLPLNLLEQFHRIANIYFLVIASLQQIPGVSPTGKYTTAGPLFLVMSVTCIKEAYEDYKRHRSDNEVNNRLVEVLIDGKFVPKLWKNVLVGDVFRLYSDQYIPADVVLLSSSDKSGIAYIQTANLDGEINLKIRQGLTQTLVYNTPEAFDGFSGYIECEHPNNNLHKFEGTLYHHDDKYALDSKMFLPRGSMMKNTEWAIGVAVFTGPETKLMMNSSQAPIKRTSVEISTNHQILMILAVEVVICVFGTLMSSLTNEDMRSDHWYLQLENTNFDYIIRSFFTFLILFNSMIPISLYVTMEMVKVIQGYFINNDRQMYYALKDTPANARTTNLNEELGQIEYVFSDKTGTLTQNRMDFMLCSVYDQMYGNLEAFIKQSQQATTGKVDVNDVKAAEFDSDALLHEVKSGSEQGQRIHEYLVQLSVCHTVIPEKKENGIAYQAASPDEGALVEAAASLGYRFTERSTEGITVEYNGARHEYAVYQILEFNSVRKRMSVICRTPEGKLKLYCKGADSIIYSRLSNSTRNKEITLGFLEKFATYGLRTLCLASIDLDEMAYKEWSKRYHEAATSLENRDEKIDELAEEIERDMELIGTTAIEDKLQDGVPETISTLIKAGIKVWVLTGDKQETAINIGYACGLLNDSMKLIVVNHSTPESTKQSIEEQMKELNLSSGNVVVDNLALIIDGETLRFALDEKIKFLFLDLAKVCCSVICCRVTPRQKALVVELVKDNVEPSPLTLAIGDGANDVSMIQSAHVGIGISGEEGMQAVFASDYSIAQFRFLLRLLLIHGRWSYIRTSRVILYCFYKNITLNIVQLLFIFYSGFSGQTMFESWTLSAYNVFFTSLPVIVLGVLDRDVREKLIMENPPLYILGQEKYYFNSKVFWGWALNAFTHSLILFFITVNAYANDIPSPSGLNSSLWMTGTTIYSCVILTVNLKLTLELASWTFVHHIVVWGTIIFWAIYIPVYSRFYEIAGLGPEFVGMDEMLYQTPIFYLITILVVLSCLSRDIVWKYIKRTYMPKWYHIVQELEDSTPAKDFHEREITVDVKRKFLRISIPGFSRKHHTGFAFSDPGETPDAQRPNTRRFSLRGLLSPEGRRRSLFGSMSSPSASDAKGSNMLPTTAEEDDANL